MGMQMVNGQSASFNFTAAAATVGGWTNVAGDPHAAVRSVTAPSGITINSVATANWYPDPTGNACAFNGGGANGSGFFPAAVFINHWYEYGTSNAATIVMSQPQLIIGGLHTDSSYSIRVSGSFADGIPSPYNMDPTDYTIAGAAYYGTLGINGNYNTTDGAIFNNVVPDSTGSIRLYLSTANGSTVATLSGLQIVVGPAPVFWFTQGNLATPGDSSFIGTLDNNRLPFRTNDVERMNISPSGTVTVGTVNMQDSFVVHGNITLVDSSTDQAPLNLYCNNIFSPFINLRNLNSSEGASIGMRYWNDSGLVAQFFSGCYNDYYCPNGFAFHQISAGGFEFVGQQPTNYVSWGNNFKRFGGAEMIFYPHTGHLIIGSVTDNGNSLLQINGNMWTTGLTIPTGATSGYVLTSDAGGNATWQPGGAGGHWLPVGGGVYDSLDNVAIGTSNTQGYKLAVNGSAVFTRVVVKPQANWPDYVFKKGYVLPELATLDRYIRVHHHLPGIGSEREIRQNGIDIAEEQGALLKKVEELTLYLIRENQGLSDQNKRVADQAKQIVAQGVQLEEDHARLEAQQKEIDELKKMILEKARR